MSSYVDNLIELLYKNYNFKIIEMKKNQGLCSKWALWSEENNIVEVMFFSQVQNYRETNMKVIISDLKELFQNRTIKFIQIVLDEKAHIFMDENNNPQLNCEIYPQCGLVLINPVLNQVVYCTSESQNFANKISGIMGYMENSKGITDKEKIRKLIVTYTIIALNVLVYAATSYLSGNIVDSNLNVLVIMGAKVNSLIAQGQYYRLFTCMFLHAGIVHLGVNMYSLYIMGTFIEKVYGKFKYIVIYLISGLFSSVFSYMFSSSVSVGASGAIFGLLGAALVFALEMKHKMGKGFIMNILSIIIMNLIIGFSIANVDNFGHIGGLVGGILVTYLLGSVKSAVEF